jgi:hypothetical protein
MSAVRVLVPAGDAPAEPALPALIAREGDRAALRFLEFFPVNILNRNTRAANARAAGAFLRWCEGQWIDVQPMRILR